MPHREFFMPQSEAEIADLVATLKLEAHDQRKKRQQRAWDYYWGDGAFWTYERMKELFSEPKKYQIVPVSVVRTMIDERAMLYKEPAARTLIQAEGTPLASQDNAQAMWTDARMNVVMKDVERLTLLQRTLLVKPTWREWPDTQLPPRLELDVIGAHVADVIQYRHDVTRAQAVVYSLVYPDTPTHRPEFHQLRYVYWDAERHRTYTGDGKPEADPTNPGGVNPYGLLPFVTFRDRIAHDRFWLPSNDEIVEANEALNLALTDLFHGLRLQSWGQLVVIGSNLPAEFTIGPDKALKIEVAPGAPTPSVFYAKPDSSIRDNLETIQKVISWIARMSHQNPADFVLEGTMASGFALRVRALPKLEDRQDRAELFRAYEEELFSVMRRVWNQHNPGRQVPTDARLKVDFAEPSFPTDPREELDVLSKELQLGLVDLLSVVRRRNPDLKDDAEAEAWLAKNVETRNRLRKTVGLDFGLRDLERPAAGTEEVAGEETEEAEEAGVGGQPTE